MDFGQNLKISCMIDSLCTPCWLQVEPTPTGLALALALERQRTLPRVGRPTAALWPLHLPAASKSLLPLLNPSHRHPLPPCSLPLQHHPHSLHSSPPSHPHRTGAAAARVRQSSTTGFTCARRKSTGFRSPCPIPITWRTHSYIMDRILRKR